jgi:hypothetical protein
MARTDEKSLTDEIEITPAMLAAGVAEFDLIDFDSAVAGAEDWVADIYREMVKAKVASEWETLADCALL